VIKLFREAVSTAENKMEYTSNHECCRIGGKLEDDIVGVVLGQSPYSPGDREESDDDRQDRH
jgi:hypothetical protein